LTLWQGFLQGSDSCGSDSGSMEIQFSDRCLQLSHPFEMFQSRQKFIPCFEHDDNLPVIENCLATDGAFVRSASLKFTNRYWYNSLIIP